MSHWSHWPPGSGPLQGSGAVQPTGMIPNNLATATYPAAVPAVTNAMQYPPEQWTQMQQQSWQQWAQWQQQYQHWHQQYGAEYHRSLSALASNPMGMSNPTASSNNPSLPPPLPNDTQPPPPPPPNDDNSGDANTSNQSGSIQLRSGVSDYSVSAPLPPPNVHQQPYCITSLPPPIIPQQQINQQFRNINQQSNWQNIKRPYNQIEEIDSSAGKRHMLDNQGHWSAKGQFQQQPQPLFPDQQHPQNAGQVQKLHNLEELIEAEKKFDKEFPAWEAQFNKWKEQNANHPDKVQFLQYEKQWESWRNSFLERRTQMRKKRMMLEAALESLPQHHVSITDTNTSKDTLPRFSGQSFSSEKQKVPAVDVFINESGGNTGFNTSQKEFSSNDIFNSSPSLGGTISKSIPGLDLVKDNHNLNNTLDDQNEKIEIDKDQNYERNGKQNSKCPDLDAISKGINNILGDTKLMNILSKVTSQQQPRQYQQIQSTHHQIIPASDSLTISQSTIKQPTSSVDPDRSVHNGSNQSFGPPMTMMNDDYPDRYNTYCGGSINTAQAGHEAEKENLINIDDQTRMSSSLNDDNDVPFNHHQQSGGGDFNQYTENVNSQVRNNFRGGFGDNDNRKFGGKFGEKSRNMHKQDTRFNRTEYKNFDDRYSDNYQYKNKKNVSNNQQIENENFTEDIYLDQWNENSFDNYNQCYQRSDEDESKDIPLQQKRKEQENSQSNLGYCRSPVPSSPPQSVADDLFEPKLVIEYEHKSITEPDVSLEIRRMFDYRHKAVNRIPYTHRPGWLLKTLMGIRQFNPLGVAMENQFDRRSNNGRYERDSNGPRIIGSGAVGDTRITGNDLPMRCHTTGDSVHGYDGSQKNVRNMDKNEEKSHSFNTYDNGHGHNKENQYVGSSNQSSSVTKNTDRSGPCQNSDLFMNTPLELDDLSDDDAWGNNTSIDKSQYAMSSTAQGNIDSDSKDHTEYSTSCGSLFNPESNSNYNSNVTSSSQANITTLDDLINPPGRHKRAARIVIILRGPPGSGKTYLAKMIKDREVENGGSAPRILSLDDYFMVEKEKEIVTDTGKRMKTKEMVYEYEMEMEESYRLSLIKSFKKTITDGYFNFIVIDNINQKVRNFGEIWSFAKQNGFQVYVCQLDLDPVLCSRRNIHNRSQSDIEDYIAGWEPTPLHHPLVDATNFLQSCGPITEVEMEEVNHDVDQSRGGDDDEDNEKDKDHIRSKWDTFDCTLNNLARLDGVSKPLRRSTTMEEYLQFDHESGEGGDDWRKSNSIQLSKQGQKKVRWADLEEQKEQKKMKALGFIVGQTDWNRMMDSTNGERALTQTKYIERVKKY